VSTAPELQYLPMITTNGAGGAIVAWQDTRNGTTDVYAQGIGSDGVLGGGPLAVPRDDRVSLALGRVFPNPLRGARLSVNFTLADPGSGSLELLDVAGRRVAAREIGAFGPGPHTVELASTAHLAPGLYMVRLRQGANERMTRVAVLR
jgi:hypothetical protein